MQLALRLRFMIFKPKGAAVSPDLINILKTRCMSSSLDRQWNFSRQDGTEDL